MQKIRASEVFFSFQGEGRYTGQSSVWVRLFGCNLKCPGFSQQHPTKPETHVILTKDISAYNSMEELPVMTHGCDSAYSWDSDYKHLATDYSVDSLADKIISLLPSMTFSPHAVTGNMVDLCFTGGEPMLQQSSICEIIRELVDRGNYPRRIQIETNGTILITQSFRDFVAWLHEEYCIEVCFNISPKLYYVSGEKDAVNYAIYDYVDISNTCDFKFVLNNTNEAWNELLMSSAMLKIAIGSVSYDRVRFYVMPVGGSKEQQETEEVKQIVQRALNEGYHISGRLHCNMLGNAMGV